MAERLQGMRKGRVHRSRRGALAPFTVGDATVQETLTANDDAAIVIRITSAGGDRSDGAVASRDDVAREGELERASVSEAGVARLRSLGGGSSGGRPRGRPG